MVSYFKSFFSYFFTDSQCETSDEDKELFLVEELLDLEEQEKQQHQPSIEPQPLPRTAVCFQRTGIITDINEDNIQIDKTLMFDRAACTINLNLNDKVVYLCYKENDAIVVVRILETCGVYWGEEDLSEDSFKLIEHVLIGEVDFRQERLVYVKTGSEAHLVFSLDNVSGTFIPVRGDWLDMTCKVKFDEAKPMDMNAETVMEVLSFKPVRSKIKEAVITQWEGYEGICDKQLFFNKNCIQNSVEPQVGCKVLIEAIESNQGTCQWRVIKMEILECNITQNQLPVVESTQPNTLDIEKSNNVTITFPLKFERVCFDNNERILSLDITNHDSHPLIFNKWIILSKRRDSQVTVTPFLTKPQRLYPSQTYSLKVSCQPKFYGKSKEHLILMFKGFKVERTIEINVVNENIMGDMPNSEHKYTSVHERIEILKKMRNNEKSLLPGVRLIKPPKFIAVKIGLFPIPEKVWHAVLGDSDETVHSKEFSKMLAKIETKLPCLIQTLNMNNYTDRWHTLLYMEEVQATINMRVYDMPRAYLSRCQEYLTVEVKGLSERRPSLIKGDKVIVNDVWDTKAPSYEGFIHDIKGDLILIKFHRSFHDQYTGSDVSIEFHFSRTVYRKSHQAVNNAIFNLGPGILFPSQLVSRPPQVSPDKLTNIQWFNKDLNARQKAAVTNVLLGECRPMPYCIYGPPGTGKTITVVETILQILTLMPDSRILVATPSNSAANLITERLIQYKNFISNSIIRLIAHYLTDSENIPEAIKPYCVTLNIATEGTMKSTHTVKENINLNVPASYIGRHRVTIGTCYSHGTLAMVGLPKGHFTHVIIDEAGQAIEPEIMIPMTFIDKENGQIILAGDPMQLGPVVISKYCVEFGMDLSYLSRLLETYPYQKDLEAFSDGFNEKLVTRLTDNYRSVQEVLTLPSQMFYDGSLVPKIDRNIDWIVKIIEIVSEIFELERGNITGGIFVHGVKGINTRARDSPSWYNPQEASMVALTACKLYEKGMTPDDIGIVTPYVAQLKYIRMLFDAMGLPRPKIGSVEEFQGQERRLIIISTVRSTESYVAEDQKHFLGFVKNPKRLNVAITRAQVAVILFCDPHLLLTDPLWKKVIQQAINDNKYMGCDLPGVYGSKIDPNDTENMM